MGSGPTVELTLRDALRVLWRARMLIVLFLILGALLGYYFQSSRPPIYTSSVTIRNGSANTYGFVFPVISNQEAQVIFQNPAALLGKSMGEVSASSQIANASISFQKIDDSYYFVLSVSSTKKNEARRLCEELATAYVREGNARHRALLKPMRERLTAISGVIERVNEELKSIEARVGELRSPGSSGDLAELTSLEMRYGNLLSEKTQLERDLIDLQLKLGTCRDFAIVSPPSAEKATRVSPALVATAGALAGFMLGAYIAFFAHFLRG
jgi:hypothetical protein